jgi:hypothetical protein
MAGLVVMRLRHRYALALVAGVVGALVLVAMVAGVAGHGVPLADVTVTGLVFDQETLTVSAEVVNTGRVPMEYNGSPPFMTVRWESGGRWRSSEPAYVSYQSSFGFLLPGRVLQYQLGIPADAQQLQVGCYFESMGPRARLVARLTDSGWWRRLYPASEVLVRCLPEGRTRGLEFWSDITPVRDRLPEAPHNQSSQATAASPLAFEQPR